MTHRAEGNHPTPTTPAALAALPRRVRTMNEHITAIEDIIDLIEEARAAWTGLNWETCLSDADTEVLAEAVAKDADKAGKFGFHAENVLGIALKLTRTTNVCYEVEIAIGYLQKASDIERAYGDNPAWGPALKAAEKLSEELRDELAAEAVDA